MELARRWRTLAAAAAASGALVGVGLIANGSSATAASTQSCGNHAVTIEIKEANQPTRKLKVQTKNVKASGFSCKAAFKFLDALYKNSTHGTPEHFKCKAGKAKEPKGYFPEVCTHASKKIEYGAQGG